ncbi:Protein FYV4, mitochondrial [Pseudozyma hubeiensis]|nr:Protein FYV4, mitochondrial [Pseudozyma hubeiensis]
MFARITAAVTASAKASSSRTITTTAAVAAAAPTRSVIPKPQGTISDPATFLTSISRTRRDLASNSSLTSAIGEEWSNIFTIRSDQLKQAGVTTKDRRYFLWAREKFRQGANPEVFAIDAKPKKKVRGWGARVQTAERIRVRGVRRPGEK